MNQEVAPIYREAVAKASEAVAKKKKKAASESDGTARGKPGYFRCVSAADDNLGRLMTTLDELGLAENTVLVFSSDNGYYLGEHEARRQAVRLRREPARSPCSCGIRNSSRRGNLSMRWCARTSTSPPPSLTWPGFPFPRRCKGGAGARCSRRMRRRSRSPGCTAWFYEYFQERAFPGTPHDPGRPDRGRQADHLSGPSELDGTV